MREKIILILIILLTINLNAQIVNYTTADGLIDNYIECITVDINDNIWFGSANGVQMYDGVNWIIYDQASYPGMISNNIKCITAMSNGDIWIGTDFGANQLVSGVSGSMWLPYTNSNGLAGNQIKSIDEDPNGGVWIGTNEGVSYFDGNTWISYSSPDLPSDDISGVAFDSNGDKWFATFLGGVTHFDGLNFTTYNTSDGLLSIFTTDIVIDNQDNKWIGTTKGMSVLDNSNTFFTNHTRMYYPPPPDTLNPVVDIDIDSWGRIWTGIYLGYLPLGGLAMWDGNQWQDYDNIIDGLVGPNIKDLSIDSQNNVWVATSTGVSKITAVTSNISNTDAELNIFPNPCSDFIYLTTQESGIKSVDLYDNLGRLVYTNKKDSFSYSIETTNFKSGIYFLSLNISDVVVRRKLIIE